MPFIYLFFLFQVGGSDEEPHVDSPLCNLYTFELVYFIQFIH